MTSQARLDKSENTNKVKLLTQINLGISRFIMNIILVLFLASIGLSYSSIPCPGGKYRCEDKQTCCQMPNEEYGCCPFPQATCCKDHIHCCPNGMRCDLQTQSCKNGLFGISVPMKVHEPAKLVELNKATQVESLETTDPETCPDGKPCDSNFTCCSLTKGGFGCCPLKDAICCTDSIHCCPQGYTCNTTLGTCDKAGVGHHFSSSKSVKQTELLIEVKATPSAKFPAENKKEKETRLCPDPDYECDDQDTCCKAAGGGYGCCPMPEATCCKDGVHCCPHGYKCVKLGCLPDKINVAYNPFFN
ncbi:progranulin-like isoform X2 [Oratosquilla oratoria]|uniref:progranulin-like isoform X2 n=1 Tax=Oratosquilla oratoria TaxID=337810 RepID=UPI003F767E5D